MIQNWKQKVLISDNIICKKNKNENLVIATVNKVKKTKGIFKICGEIIGDNNSDIYDILIYNDYLEIGLKKNDICRISASLFKVIPDDQWEKILHDQ